MKKNQQQLDTILSKALREEKLTTKEIVFLLRADQPHQMDELCSTARQLRQKHFGNKIFLYGFIYTSTYCRNDCRFCFFRKSNSQSRRYRKTTSEIITSAQGLAQTGVHLIDLTMGEDPSFHNGDGFEPLFDLVASVRRTTGLPVMVSPGVIPERILCHLAEHGAAWYACYQETHQRRLFNRLRPGQDFDRRLDTKRNAHRCGLLIEEGLLCGVGETNHDIAQSIDAMHQLNADQVRVMNFVPQPGTPMAKGSPPHAERETLISAVMRLVFPQRLIPASLDVDGLAGLERRLAAGANVVTSIVPPGEGLVGVARHCLDIEDGRRTTAAVVRVLEKCGLTPAANMEYKEWINHRRHTIRKTQKDGEALW